MRINITNNADKFRLNFKIGFQGPEVPADKVVGIVSLSF